MAKILVADDNSNIQKMVGLALKDQGIDVVAVGNGEAAVRKISDLRPDLVLADVFMPVRNGYEVCQYVKEDSSLAHIPVILLVGAFDPLDEQEAQRVGADGVLKKPFVPPDPLISMVKSALARAGVAPFGGAAEKPAVPGQASSLIVAPVGERAAAKAAENIPVLAALSPDPMDSGFDEEITARPAALKIESAGQPLAFGSLLETPVQAEQQEADLSFAPTAHPDLASERDWRSKLDEEETEEDAEAPAKASWRREGAEESFVEDAAPVQDWRESDAGEPALRPRSREAWTPTTEKQDLASIVESEETGATANGAKPAGTAAPFTGDAWAAAISAGAEDKNFVSEREKPAPEPEAPVQEFHARDAAPAVEESAAAAIPEPKEPEAAAPEKLAANSWFSATSSPWEAEAHKAGQLASAWDVPAPIPVILTDQFSSSSNGAYSAEPILETEPTTEAPSDRPPEELAEGSPAVEVQASSFADSESRPESPLEAILPEAAVETIREEISYNVESAVEDVRETSPHVDEASVQAPVNDSKADMDAIVAKVLAKMSPEVLQAVTREILKPVVEAIVRDELNSKKP